LGFWFVQARPEGVDDTVPKPDINTRTPTLPPEDGPDSPTELGLVKFALTLLSPSIVRVQVCGGAGAAEVPPPGRAATVEDPPGILAPVGFGAGVVVVGCGVQSPVQLLNVETESGV